MQLNNDYLYSCKLLLNILSHRSDREKYVQQIFKCFKSDIIKVARLLNALFADGNTKQGIRSIGSLCSILKTESESLHNEGKQKIIKHNLGVTVMSHCKNLIV